MRRIAVICGVCAVAVCGTAEAKVPVHSTAPPGNSAIQQYIESIPTDHGSRPTNSVHTSGVGGGGVSGGSGGSSGGGVSGGSSGSGSAATSAGNSAPVSRSTQRALDARGANGKAAAALARNTAPSTGGGLSATSTPAPARNTADGSSGGSSALGSLASAVTGSGSNGGLGALLPILLIVVLLGSAAMAILRRRGQT